MTDSLLYTLTQGQLKNSGITQHLCQVIREQLQGKHSLLGMSNLQVFSYYLRSNEFKFQQFLSDSHLNHKMSEPPKQLSYIKNVKSLTTKVQQLSIKKPFSRPNIMDEYYALKQCGISIGETNAVHLVGVVKNIAVENQCTNIRFWGKILGYQDYYVIQGTSAKKYLNGLGPDSENYGTGINTYSYWVTTSILGNWVQLPLVTPSQVKASRTLKYMFSGNLDKDLNGLSKFQGKQKHLLKCTIARITHSCQLCPKGLYKVNEQNASSIDVQQQFKTPQISQMNSAQSWVHLNAHILNQGRSSYYIDPKLNQEESSALSAQLGQNDPMVQRLKGISEDKPYEQMGLTTNWTVQLCGETVQVNLVGKQEGQTALYASILLRNLVWPGAATVGYKGAWTNIYIGYGQRISQQNNLIKSLTNLQVEGEEKKQFSQPNPSKPVIIQEQKPVGEEVNPPEQ